MFILSGLKAVSQRPRSLYTMAEPLDESVTRKCKSGSIADNELSLTKLAQKIAADGPHKYEKTPRRVRALFNGQYAIDTTKAYHVWEHPYYPQ